MRIARGLGVAALLASLIFVSIFASQSVSAQATPVGGPLRQEQMTVVAGGLTNGRSFTWDSNGVLYVATAGVGGDNIGTIDAPVVQTVGKLMGGKTATVVRIENGCPVTVASGLASTRDASGVTVGAAAVAFLNGELYVLIAGGGAVHGNPDMPNGVYRIGDDGSATMVANISEFVANNPVAGQLPQDYSPEGDPYAMVADETAGVFWVDEANSGQLLRISLDGTVTRAVDFSEGDPVPTALALAPDGGVYVGFLTGVPFTDGTSKVVHVAADGTVTDVWTGLTMLTAIAVGPDGSLYGLSFSTGNKTEAPFFVPGTGKVVHQTGSDSSEELATNLLMPNYMDFGPDGGLYIGFPGIGATNGEGVILRMDATGNAALATPLADPVSCVVATPAIESSPEPAASPFA